MRIFFRAIETFNEPNVAFGKMRIPIYLERTIRMEICAKYFLQYACLSLCPVITLSYLEISFAHVFILHIFFYVFMIQKSLMF